MARVQIKLPEKFIFSTKLQVRFGDLNGAHLGNHVLVSYLNESWMTLLRENGFEALRIDGCGYINADLAVIYKAESFHGDILKFEIAIADFQRYGCDIVFRVTNDKTGKEIAIAKMGLVFFDYKTKKTREVPEKFRALFE